MKGVLIWTCKGGAVMRPTWLVAVPLSVALGVPPKLHAQELWPAACPFDFVQRVSASGLPRGTDALPQCLTECPKRGTLELVREPAMAADRCFIAVSMRAPLRGDASQTASELRDIDLDGEPELLEIRGIGNRAK